MDNRKEHNDQKREQEKRPAENTSTWVKPGFKVIHVSFECTAYAGSL
jgi:hypothetical protein